MTTNNKKQLNETMLYGQESPCDTLVAIGKSMEFVSQSVFAMWTSGSEHLEYCEEGLYYILQHMTELTKHATGECQNEIETNRVDKNKITELQRLISLHQLQNKTSKNHDSAATLVAELEKTLFPNAKGQPKGDQNVVHLDAISK